MWNFDKFFSEKSKPKRISTGKHCFLLCIFYCVVLLCLDFQWNPHDGFQKLQKVRFFHAALKCCVFLRLSFLLVFQSVQKRALKFLRKWLAKKVQLCVMLGNDPFFKKYFSEVINSGSKAVSDLDKETSLRVKAQDSERVASSKMCTTKMLKMGSFIDG